MAHINIDDKEYNLASLETKHLELKTGSHQVLCINSHGDTLLNSLVEINENGLLNTTKSTYVLWTDIFCKEEDYDNLKTKLNLKDTVKLEGLEFIDVDFELIDEIFIPTKWNYSIDEKMPKTVEIKEQENYKIVSKIYTPAEIKEAFNYLGDIDFSGMTEAEINKVLEERQKQER